MKVPHLVHEGATCEIERRYFTNKSQLYNNGKWENIINIKLSNWSLQPLSLSDWGKFLMFPIMQNKIGIAENENRYHCFLSELSWVRLCGTRCPDVERKGPRALHAIYI